jgi:hypothetical protein
MHLNRWLGIRFTQGIPAAALGRSSDTIVAPPLTTTAAITTYAPDIGPFECATKGMLDRRYSGAKQLLGLPTYAWRARSADPSQRLSSRCTK